MNICLLLELCTLIPIWYNSVRCLKNNLHLGNRWWYAFTLPSGYNLTCTWAWVMGSWKCWFILHERQPCKCIGLMSIVTSTLISKGFDLYSSPVHMKRRAIAGPFLPTPLKYGDSIPPRWRFLGRESVFIILLMQIQNSSRTAKLDSIPGAPDSGFISLHFSVYFPMPHS